MQLSTVLTIGSALTRAAQDDIEVAVLVQGEWFRGHVRGLDGHGVVMDDGQGHDLVVRLDHVAVLRIDQEVEQPFDEPEVEPIAEVVDIPAPRAAEGAELTV